MSFDFTIALVPQERNLNREIQYIKSALLYADSVTLISPAAYIFKQLTDEANNKDMKSVINLINQVLTMIKPYNMDLYIESKPIIDSFAEMVQTKKLRSVSYTHRLKFERELREFAVSISDNIYQMLGEVQCRELDIMIKNNQVKITPFNHTVDDTDKAVKEYFVHLKDSLKNSYALYDEQSCELMKAAVNARVIRLSPIELRKIMHAGMTNNFIQRLPSFESASVDELIDIKKELYHPLCRFRSKMLDYSDSLQELPWNDDFESECNILYDKEVIPALLEIDEATKENSFIKNLGGKFLTDKSVWKSTGGMVVGVAAAGVIASFNDVMSSDTSMLIAGGAIAASKISSAYSEYSKRKKEIEKKDLYFYYAAGERIRR